MEHLVIFRSVLGTSKEIISVFFAITIGLAMGMGQLVYAVIIISSSKLEKGNNYTLVIDGLEVDTISVDNITNSFRYSFGGGMPDGGQFGGTRPGRR